MKAPASQRDPNSTATPGTPTKVSVRAWVVAAMLVLLAMINFGDKSVLGLAAVQISKELHLSASVYGMVASSFFLLFSLASLLVGLLANKVPSKWVLLALVVIWSLAQVPLLAVASLATLVTSRILLGAAEGPTAPVSVHASFSWFPPSKRGLPSILWGTGASLGIFLAAPTLTSLITSQGWRSAFLALAIVGAVWAILWFFVGGEGPYRSNAASSSSRSSEIEADGPGQRVPFRRLLTSATWLGSAAAGFGAYWATALGSAFVPAYLVTQHGFTPGAAANAVSLYALVSLLLPLGLIPAVNMLHNRGVSSRWSRGLAQAALAIIAGIAMLVLPHAASAAAQYALIAVAFGAVAAIYPLTYLTASEISPDRQRAGVLGALVAVSTLPGLIGPAVTGWLIESGGYTLGFTVGAAVMIACGLFALLAIRPDRDAVRIGAAPTTSVRQTAPVPSPAGAPTEGDA